MQTKDFHTSGPPAGDYPYFRRLWNTIVISLIGAAFIPLILIGGLMHHLAASALKESTLQTLGVKVRSHQEAVDRFLAERLADLRLIAGAVEMQALTSPGGMEAVLAALNGIGSYYVDLGVFDDQGGLLSYAGPGPIMDLAGVDWFETLTSHKVHISDVYCAPGDLPCFFVTVRVNGNDSPLTWRATVKAAVLDDPAYGIAAMEEDGCFLINDKGAFQTSRAGTSQWMQPSGIPVPERFDGFRVSEDNGGMHATAWLDNVPWLSVVEVDKKEIFKPIDRMLRVGILVFILGAVMIVFTALLTTNYLVARLEAKRKRIRLMDHHLRQANKMTLSLLLYDGFFQEINEALANINSAAAWIGEQSRKAGAQEGALSDLDETLGQINAEIRRGRDTINQLISLSRPSAPVVSEIDINRALDALTDRFHREAYFRNIRIHKDFQEPIPAVRTDPSQLEQVIQNLIYNALDAVEKNGEITLRTRVHGDFVQITVEDDGPGISPEAMEGLFDPPLVTRPGHLGLGLSICREIMKKLGGDITVDSQPGKGSAFTVIFPFPFKP